MTIERKHQDAAADERMRRTFSRAPSPEEIVRRQRVMAETTRLRAAVGPIHLTVQELLAPEDDEVDA
jgi:hypothetical protein